MQIRIRTATIVGNSSSRVGNFLDTHGKKSIDVFHFELHCIDEMNPINKIDTNARL